MGQNGTATLQGWTSSPNDRGTIDILTGSVLTLVLCTWSVLCLNVFPTSYSWWRRTFRKALMAGLTWLAPEFVFQLAIGQWCLARRSVRKFSQSGYEGWTIKHAFFANQGGFVLHPQLSSTEEWPPFPLDANQIHYLVTNDYIPYSAVDIELEVIKDKNKVDVLLRLLTVCQILWYLVGLLARIVQHLAITILELSTIGFIFCTLGTYYFWFNKPVDVGKPFTLEVNATLREIIIDAGDLVQRPCLETPLDFVGRDDWPFSLCWKYCWRIVGKLGIEPAPRKWPIDKIPDDYFAPQPFYPMWILFIVHTGYAAVHIAGWNFRFPSPVETIIWRVTTISVMASLLIFWFIHLCWWVWIPAIMNRRRRMHQRDGQVLADLPAKTDGKFKDPYNPRSQIPVAALLPVIFCSAVYIISRAYIILESFIDLRALPPSAYQTVDWSAFIPHF